MSRKERVFDRLVSICIILLAIALLIAVLWNCSITNIKVKGSDNTTISTEANRDSLSYDGVNWDWDFESRKSRTDTIKKDSIQ